MDNTGQHIVETQDKDYYIDHQLAVNTLYSKAKVWRGAQFVLALPLTLGLVYACLQMILVCASICIAITNLLIGFKISSLRKDAASIQEIFDTTVLNIKKNPTIDTSLIDGDIILRHSKKARQNPTLLKNATTWYEKDIAEVPTKLASLLCQRTNVNYDHSLRNQYLSIIIALNVLSIVMLLALAIANDLSLRSLLVEVIFPLLPLMILSGLEIYNSQKVIKNLLRLKGSMADPLASVTVTGNQLRQFQDQIFDHRQKTPMIPNFVYNLKRTSLEGETNYSIANYIDENRDRITK